MAEDVGVAQEFVTTVIDLSAGTSQTVRTGPCVLRGTYVNTALGGIAPSLTQSNGLDAIIIPANAPAGSPFHHFDTTRDGIIVTNTAGATGSIAIVWKPFSNPLQFDPER